MRADGGWPAKPYRGLNYLRREDRPLLAGRDEDEAACTELLAHSETRVLMLHGLSGCGKSSFMRAGLIPGLEVGGAGFQFLRWDATDDETAFIRCTASPMTQIAAHLHTFAGEPYRMATPAGERSIDLSPAQLGAESWTSFLEMAQTVEGTLLRSLEGIAAAIPRTPVLIVDQAEEVLTLQPGQEGVADRVRFFAFLRSFQRTRLKARILVALRTEYLGRFLDAVQVGYRQSTGFRHYFLPELSPAALHEAIARPTYHEDVPPWGAPYDVYGFDFDPRLPEKITADVLAARYTGPALPVLQLVCLGLYENGRHHNATFRIEPADYLAMGEVQGLIVAHIQTSLHAVLGPSDAASSVRDVLTGLYLIQDDGTVVARTRPLQWILNELGKSFDARITDALLDRLARPETLVVRRLRSVEPDGSTVDKVTLGHDSIALAIERWRALDAEKRAAEAERKKREEVAAESRRSGIAFLLFVATVTVALFFSEVRSFAVSLPGDTYQKTVSFIRDLVPGLYDAWIGKLATSLVSIVVTLYAILFFIGLPFAACVWTVAIIDALIRMKPSGLFLRFVRLFRPA